jgi:hypothetical protein
MISRTLTPILSIVIAVMIFMFFTQPTFSEVTAVKTEMSEYTTAIEKYNLFSAKLEEKLSVKTNRSASDNERLDRLVPDEIDDTQILVDIEALAEKNGMLFGNISVKNNNATLARKTENVSQGLPASQELASVDVTFGVIGSYEQFDTFMLDLESSLTLFEVIGLSYTASPSSFQQFDLTVRVYALPEVTL